MNNWKKIYPLLYSHMSQEYSMVLIDDKLSHSFVEFVFFFSTPMHMWQVFKNQFCSQLDSS